MTHQTHIVSLKAGMAIQARDEVLNTLVLIADDYIQQGLTQEGADVLAYVMRCEAIPTDIEDHAIELWEDLARWICPRVLLDAETFGKKAYLEDVVEYVLAGV
ncbi:MAG: hypothetical protein AAFV93_06040 [Chloroflexota bacterium]